jgi:hypothetical protein
LTFDPALSDQIRNDPWAEAHGFDPTGAPQVLHKLPFTGIRKFHFFTFSPSFFRHAPMIAPITADVKPPLH